ncbi:MAG TPA: YeeE/YedE family protein [Propionibacteriaceae bacterium]|nr:YeeE/YedE family protein [Propionibacteriaceae bacterium]HPZ50321.1 YeeE/YedE family protein [Propionibacteriaceae bacterium]
MVITGLVLGAVLGFVLQRGRFCVTGAFRDVWLQRKTRWLTAFLIVIAVQSVGYFALLQLGIVKDTAKALPWAAVIIGSIIFGVSIVLAGGCATGTYYRSGEGLVGSWIALVGYAVGAAAMKYGALKSTNEGLRSITAPNLVSIQATLGISPWILVALFVAGVGYASYRHLTARTKLPVATLPARYTGLRHLLFEKTWHPFATALVIGVIAIAAYPLSYAAGRQAGLGITTPSADLVAYAVTGDAKLINWGALLVVGILIGSFIAAKGSGEFRIRIPDTQQTLRSVVGGLGMGIGASWAGGCTIGNSMVYTAQFTYQGWAALLSTLLGVGLGVRLFITNHRRAGAVTPAAAAPSPVLVNA